MPIHREKWPKECVRREDRRRRETVKRATVVGIRKEGRKEGRNEKERDVLGMNNRILDHNKKNNDGGYR